MGIEINKFSDIIGVVTAAAIPEGRMVLLTSQTDSYNFGSRADLPGIRIPVNAAEALQAKYVAVFAQDNRGLPIYEPTPSSAYQLRSGWGVGDDNVPITGSTVYLTHPGNMVGQTIPSGELAVAHAGGVYTVPSGGFVWSADLEVPGALLEVLNRDDDGAGDAGKLSHAGAGTIAVVERYKSSTGALTFRTLKP